MDKSSERKINVKKAPHPVQSWPLLVVLFTLPM